MSAQFENARGPVAVARRVSRGTLGWVAFGVLAALFIALGSKFVPNDDPRVIGTVAFDPAVFGEENFPAVQEAVTERALDAVELASAIAADRDAAVSEHAVQSSGGPVFSVTFTGVAGEGSSGIYPITIDGLDSDLLIRVQTGPAINGTELRDASGEIQFGQFRNQIEFQNAAAALNDQLKAAVLEGVDTADLQGKAVTVTGAFTLVNPEAWLVTPVSLEAS